MHSQMTIGRKLTLGFAGLVTLLVVLSFAFLSSVGSLKDSFDVAVDKTAPKIAVAGILASAESDMLAWQRGMMLYTFAKNHEQANASSQRLRESSEIAKQSLEALQPLVVDEEGRRIVESSKAGLASWLTHITEIERLCNADDAVGALAYGMTNTLPIYDALSKDIARFKDLQGAVLQADRADAGSVNNRSRWLALIMLGLSVGLGVLVMMVVRQITRVLQKVAAEMADGAGQVASAASQVAASSQSLAQGASEQAASLEETSAATEEIHSMARRNTENSNSAATLVTQSQGKFEETKTSLDEMVTAMTEITASSGKISKIIKVIDEIAFQTNILALNAAVEAARAGEAGLGFAVVADEVRTLAQRCAQAARDTAELIEDSVTKSNAGKVKVDQVAGAMRAIAEDAGKTKILVDEISVGSQEQARGIEQIGSAITQMDHVTQKSAASAEEGASAAEELTAQSETLKTVVAQLVQLVGGGQKELPMVTHETPKGPGADSRKSLTAMAEAVNRHAPPPPPRRVAAVRKPEHDEFPMETEF